MHSGVLVLMERVAMSSGKPLRDSELNFVKTSPVDALSISIIILTLNMCIWKMRVSTRYHDIYCDGPVACIVKYQTRHLGW